MGGFLPKDAECLLACHGDDQSSTKGRKNKDAPWLAAGSLLEVNDFSAPVLAGDRQTRFTTGQRLRDFSEHFLGGVVGLA